MEPGYKMHSNIDFIVISNIVTVFTPDILRTSAV